MSGVDIHAKSTAVTPRVGCRSVDATHTSYHRPRPRGGEVGLAARRLKTDSTRRSNQPWCLEGRAGRTVRLRPSNVEPFMRSMAFGAASPDISTKPNPLERPDFLSVMMTVS